MCSVALVVSDYDPLDCRLLSPWDSPQSMGFSRQEYWRGLSCPSPGDLPNPGMEPMPPVSNTLKVNSLSTEPPGRPNEIITVKKNEYHLTLYRATLLTMTETQCIYSVQPSKPPAASGHCALEMWLVKLSAWTFYKILTKWLLGAMIAQHRNKERPV